jgi:hypothetical protein
MEKLATGVHHEEGAVGFPMRELRIIDRRRDALLLSQRFFGATGGRHIGELLILSHDMS